jgi:hypothetical protein
VLNKDKDIFISLKVNRLQLRPTVQKQTMKNGAPAQQTPRSQSQVSTWKLITACVKTPPNGLETAEDGEFNAEIWLNEVVTLLPEVINSTNLATTTDSKAEPTARVNLP